MQKIKCNHLKQPKQKTCKVCSSLFLPRSSLQKVCGPSCAMEFVKAKNNALEAKKKREVYRTIKNKLKSITDHLKEAQAVFNSYIRERDKHLPCISCGRHHQGQFHAGHYRTTKAAPQLRFDEDNVHKQCSVCNNHLSGNITEYRINLVKKIGIERVNGLENNSQLHRYTVDEAKSIKEKYKQKLKELKNN